MFQSVKRSRIAFFIALGLVISALFTGRIPAQQPSPGPQQKQNEHKRGLPESDDVLRVDTDLVPVSVTVTDKSGRPVRNLKQDDFKLFEDGAQRPIAFFNME